MFFARGFTGIIDIFGMFYAVEILKADEMFTKCVIQVIVIILNYILGKRVVFNKLFQFYFWQKDTLLDENIFLC